jgi:hypothetical protein
MDKDSRAEFNRKMAVFNSVKAEVEAFVANGGDLKSPEAGPLSVKFLKATSDMWQAAGGDPFIEPDTKPGQA